jgi:type I restriction enzyme S subunit
MLLSNLNLLATAPGGVARLRELILTLAVQGKLVPQDPKDEPASELLKKIRAEKDRLIAEGKIKRDKPLAEIGEEEEPFGLPVGWEWVPLQHVGYTQTGTTPDKKNPQMYGSDIPFIKPGDIYPNHVEYENEALSQEGLTDSGRVAPAGSLLMVCIGTIGKSNLVNRACSFNQQINSITPLCCSPEYVKLYCRSPYFQGEAWARSSSTTIAILNKGKWEAIPLALPPLAEQSRIVTRVEELMRLCDALEAKGQIEATQHAQLVSTLLGTLTDSETPAQLAESWQRIATHFDLLLDRPQAVDALEQTFLQLAVRGLLVPQDPQDEPASILLKKIRAEKDKLILEGKIKRDKPLPPTAEDEQPFALPKGWQWVPIETLADVGTGTTPSRDNAAFFSGGSIPWVTSGETGKAFIAETAQHVTELALSQTSLTIYPVGTLIVAMYGQGKTRGQVSELQIEATTNQACAAIVLVEPSVAHRNFVKLVFEKSYDEIRELSAGGAQPNLNVGKIKSTLIPVPPLAEQSRIVTRVASLRRLCADLRQRLTASQSTQAHLAEALVQEVQR